jgi:nitrous oxide reductase accessory protein NosL
MVISDRRFAAAYFSEPRREWRKFDDIGCLVNSLLQEGADAASTIYVSDYNKGVLIDALTAHYVSANPRLLATPMGYGVVALENLNAARALAARLSGRVFAFPELLKMFKG